MYKDVLNEIEDTIVGVYDNDTIKAIIEYLQKRVKDIEIILKEEVE